jgi:cytochrome c oxidase subunit 3/cytochrome c oxidase subunit I+III
MNFHVPSEPPIPYTAHEPAPVVSHERASRPAGWWGMVLFVATEATLFGTIFGTYYYLRFRAVEWPPHGVPPPEVAVPLILTGVLVLTSIPMQAAFNLARDGRVAAMRVALGAALIVQCGYLAMQIRLFQDDLDTFSPHGSAYGSVYFLMLGAHHAHVLVGILLVAWLLVRTLSGLTSYRLTGLQATTFYWHFVNVLALCVVGAQLSARV